jgi:adenylate cyclase
MYRLSYQDGDSPQTHTFSSGEVVIGRSPDCQVVLKDFGISRQHARIVVDDEGVRIQDLKSKNGTSVNGTTVMEAVLQDGDRILLGKFQLVFGRSLEGKVELSEDHALSEDSGTIVRSVGDLSKLLAPSADPDASAIAEAKKAPDVQEIAKLNRILKVLLDFAKDLNEARSVDEVLQRIMEIVFDHVPADRGFLMLRDEDGGDRLTPMVVKHRAAGGDQGKITISKTIADRVLKDRVSILTSDAQIDPRFGAGDSIRFHGSGAPCAHRCGARSRSSASSTWTRRC